MKRTSSLLVLCLFLSGLLAACAGPTPPATSTAPPPAASPTALPPATATSTGSPTPRPTAFPTRTPLPPSPTPTATASPTTTPPPVTVLEPGTIDWDTTTPLPIASSGPFDLHRGQQLIFHNGYAYVFGGEAQGYDPLRIVYSSPIGPNGELGDWQIATTLPAGPFYDFVAVKAGSFVYLITGSNGQTAVHFAAFEADGSIGGWNTTASLTPSRQNFAATSYENFIYAVGGNSGGNQTFVQYNSAGADGRLDAWRDAPALPDAIQAHTLLAYNGHLYVFGGIDENNQRLNTVYTASIKANGSVGPWTETTQLPAKPLGFSTFESNSYIYLLGGTLGGVYYSRIQDDFTLSAWTEASALPVTSLEGLRTGAYNGVAYAVGGLRNGTFRDTVYFGAIGSGTITATPPAPEETPAHTSTPAGSPTPPPPTHTPSGAACDLTIGQEVTAAAGANLWSEPDVLTGTILGPVAEGTSLYILAGPTWGRIIETGEAGWWWQISLSAGGPSAGWLWEARIAECD